ncbi:hypothetical protein AGLY_009264 [Aphis glycines]|uniref:Uncharacterized protein n=1 Tax=Aphis glycines TaxID=307491 RepID=A0A6G0TI76_APHGL|nr:hypothetical protein AGLY_009264 [Aphis glycines]
MNNLIELGNVFNRCKINIFKYTIVMNIIFNSYCILYLLQNTYGIKIKNASVKNVIFIFVIFFRQKNVVTIYCKRASSPLFSTYHCKSDGVFRDFEELLVYGHHSGHASENKHAAVRVENRRGRHTTSGAQFEERELVAGHVHGNAATGNYRGGGYNLEPNTYGTALGLSYSDWYTTTMVMI